MAASETPFANYRIDYAIDNHGNTTQFSYPVSSGETTYQVAVNQIVDQNGWVIRQERMIDGSLDKLYENSLEKNADGQVVKVVSTSDGNAVSETIYEYYDNGMLKKRTTTQSNGAGDSEEFDEAGYRTEQLNIDPSGRITGVHYEWRFDSTGAPIVRTASSVGGFSLNPQVTPEVAIPILDVEGNIIEYQDENGLVVQRITWVKVESPSDYVNVFNRLKR